MKEQTRLEPSTQKKNTKRARHLAGSLIAKELLMCLRQCRESESSQGLSCAMWDSTAEIEMWEDLIHAHIKQTRNAPREQLDLDSETIAALNEFEGGIKHHFWKDHYAESRRRFALHAIQKVVEATLNMTPGERPRGAEWKVEIRKMTNEERAIELMLKEAALPPGKDDNHE